MSFSGLGPFADRPYAIGERPAAVGGSYIPAIPLMSGREALDSLVPYFPTRRMDSQMHPARFGGGTRPIDSQYLNKVAELMQDPALLKLAALSLSSLQQIPWSAARDASKALKGAPRQFIRSSYHPSHAPGSARSYGAATPAGEAAILSQKAVQAALGRNAAARSAAAAQAAESQAQRLAAHAAGLPKVESLPKSLWDPGAYSMTNGRMLSAAERAGVAAAKQTGKTQVRVVEQPAAQPKPAGTPAAIGRDPVPLLLGHTPAPPKQHPATPKTINMPGPGRLLERAPEPLRLGYEPAPPKQHPATPKTINMPGPGQGRLKAKNFAGALWDEAKLWGRNVAQGAKQVAKNHPKGTALALGTAGAGGTLAMVPAAREGASSAASAVADTAKAGVKSVGNAVGLTSSAQTVPEPSPKTEAPSTLSNLWGSVTDFHKQNPGVLPLAGGIGLGGMGLYALYNMLAKKQKPKDDDEEDAEPRPRRKAASFPQVTDFLRACGAFELTDEEIAAGLEKAAEADATFAEELDVFEKVAFLPSPSSLAPKPPQPVDVSTPPSLKTPDPDTGGFVSRAGRGLRGAATVIPAFGAAPLGDLFGNVAEAGHDIGLWGDRYHKALYGGADDARRVANAASDDVFSAFSSKPLPQQSNVSSTLSAIGNENGYDTATRQWQQQTVNNAADSTLAAAGGRVIPPGARELHKWMIAAPQGVKTVTQAAGGMAPQSASEQSMATLVERTGRLSPENQTAVRQQSIMQRPQLTKQLLEQGIAQDSPEYEREILNAEHRLVSSALSRQMLAERQQMAETPAGQQGDAVTQSKLPETGDFVQTPSPLAPHIETAQQQLATLSPEQQQAAQEQVKQQTTAQIAGTPEQLQQNQQIATGVASGKPDPDAVTKGQQFFAAQPGINAKNFEGGWEALGPGGQLGMMLGVGLGTLGLVHAFTGGGTLGWLLGLLGLGAAGGLAAHSGMLGSGLQGMLQQPIRQFIVSQGRKRFQEESAKNPAYQAAMNLPQSGWLNWARDAATQQARKQVEKELAGYSGLYGAGPGEKDFDDAVTQIMTPEAKPAS